MSEWDWMLTINGRTYPLRGFCFKSDGKVEVELIERENTKCCPTCNGAGELFGYVVCGHCRGSGAVTESDGYLTIEDLGRD